MSEPAVGSNSSVTNGASAALEVAVASGKTYWWCACGRSKQQPFCDGSHKGTAFTPVKYQATETGTKAFCGCKQTHTQPLCDHANQLCATGTKSGGG